MLARVDDRGVVECELTRCNFDGRKITAVVDQKIENDDPRMPTCGRRGCSLERLSLVAELSPKMKSRPLHNIQVSYSY